MARRKTIAENPLDDLSSARPSLGGGLSLAVASEPAATATTTPNREFGVIEARRLILRDDHDRVRAEIGVEDKDGVCFALRDGDGAARLELSVADGGRARVVVRDGGGDIRAVLDVTEAGRPTLVLGDREERARLALGVSERGASFIELLREDGETRLFGIP